MVKPINAVYAMHSINGLAGSFIGIFIPIYLLLLGYSLSELFIYYIVYAVCILLFFFLVAWFTNMFGIKKGILIGYTLLFLYLWLLYALENSNISIYLIAAVYALHVAFYWFAMHIVFIEHTHEDTTASSISKLMAWPGIVSLFAPVIGAGIAILFGFTSLIALSFIIYLIAMLLVLPIPDIKTDAGFHPRVFIELFRKQKKYFSFEIVENIREEMEGIIWPVFVFLAFRDFLSIGIVGTTFALGGIIFTLMIGKHADKKSKSRLMRIGAIIMIGLWIARYFVDKEFVVYGITILAGFFEALLVIPYTTIAYNLARKHNTAEFVVFREIPIAISRVAIYSIALLLVNNLDYMFFITAFVNLFFFFY